MNRKKLKRFLSAIISTILILSTSISAFAEEKTTIVTYTAPGIEAYEVTVPATLETDTEGSIEIDGTWASNREIVVTVPETVEMESNLGGTEVVDITVSDSVGVVNNTITIEGNNRNVIDSTYYFKTSAVDSNILFGTYTGIITYTIEMADIQTELVAGLYNAAGERIVSWEDAGIDIEKDYSSASYKTDTSSAYYVLANTPEYVNVTKIVVPHDIRKIGRYAFAECLNLQEIMLPVNALAGYDLFYGCSNLRVVRIPDDVQWMDLMTFGYTDKLESVIWKGVTYTENNKSEFNQAIIATGIVSTDIWWK